MGWCDNIMSWISSEIISHGNRGNSISKLILCLMSINTSFNFLLLRHQAKLTLSNAGTYTHRFHYTKRTQSNIWLVKKYILLYWSLMKDLMEPFWTHQVFVSDFQYPFIFNWDIITFLYNFSLFTCFNIINNKPQNLEFDFLTII